MGKTYKDGHGRKPTSKHNKYQQGEEWSPTPPIAQYAPPAMQSPPPQRDRVFPPSPPHNERREDPISAFASENFKGEGKLFYIDAVRNSRGNAIRIAEVSKGKRSITLIPEKLVPEFLAAFTKIAEKAKTSGQ